MLSHLNTGKDDGSGARGGDTGMPTDFQDLMYERLLNEVDVMMQTASQLM
jgi:hypothetical protein